MKVVTQDGTLRRNLTATDKVNSFVVIDDTGNPVLVVAQFDDRFFVQYGSEEGFKDTLGTLGFKEDDWKV